MRSRFELFLLSSQIASTSISLVSNYEFQILVNIDHRTDQGLSVHFDVSDDYCANKIYQWMKNDRENLDNIYSWIQVISDFQARY